MESFSFIQITDHHLLESEEQLREGFSPGYALRMVMRHIAEHVADNVDFIISMRLSTTSVLLFFGNGNSSWMRSTICALVKVVVMVRLLLWSRSNYYRQQNQYVTRHLVFVKKISALS